MFTFLAAICLYFPGLSRSPTPRQLERALDELNAGRPQCPVGLHTLIVPRKNSQNVAPEAQPMVYLKCGHVQVKKEIILFFLIFSFECFRESMTGDLRKKTKIQELAQYVWELLQWLNFAWVQNQVCTAFFFFFSNIQVFKKLEVLTNFYEMFFSFLCRL